MPLCTRAGQKTLKIRDTSVKLCFSDSHFYWKLKFHHNTPLLSHMFTVLCVFVRVRPPGRLRRPAGGGPAVWEQTRARHGSDVLPQHVGANGGPGAPTVPVHTDTQQVRLLQCSGVPDRQVLWRHPGHQISSDWHRGGESKESWTWTSPWTGWVVDMNI